MEIKAKKSPCSKPWVFIFIFAEAKYGRILQGLPHKLFDLYITGEISEDIVIRVN